MAWDNRDLWEFAGDCGTEMKEECAAGICGLGGGEGRCGGQGMEKQFNTGKSAWLCSRVTGHHVVFGPIFTWR